MCSRSLHLRLSHFTPQLKNMPAPNFLVNQKSNNDSNPGEEQEKENILETTNPIDEERINIDLSSEESGKVVKLYFEKLSGRKYNTKNHEIKIPNQMTMDQLKREAHSIYRLKKYQVVKNFVKISGEVCCITNEQDLHDNVKAGDVIKFNITDWRELAISSILAGVGIIILIAYCNSYSEQNQCQAALNNNEIKSEIQFTKFKIQEIQYEVSNIANYFLFQDTCNRIGKRIADMMREVDAEKWDQISDELIKVILRFSDKMEGEKKTSTQMTGGMMPIPTKLEVAVPNQTKEGEVSIQSIETPIQMTPKEDEQNFMKVAIGEVPNSKAVGNAQHRAIFQLEENESATSQATSEEPIPAMNLIDKF